MTEGQGLGQSIDTSSSTPITSSQPSSQSAPAATEERRFSQSDVDSIVKRVKHDAVDTYRRQQTEQPQYVQQKYGDQSSYSQSSNSNPAQFDETRYRQIAADEAQRLRDQWLDESRTRYEQEIANKTVNNFMGTLESGRKKYSDFDKVSSDLDYQNYPNIVQLISNHVKNGEDVLYELAKNPTKMELIEQMAARGNGNLAIRSIKELSTSIDENNQSARIQFPNEPLSQMKPTNTGTDSGQLTIADFRKKYRG